jgi:5-methylcytosine-specific restriction endonuclease McrA
MPRSLTEWIGKTDDTPIPPRVKLRIFDKHQGRCAECDRKITGRLRAVFDHALALINDGSNAESNLRLLCNECHAPKTAEDVREKSTIYNKRINALGFKRKKLIPGSKGSGWKKTFNHGWVKR